MGIKVPELPSVMDSAGKALTLRGLMMDQQGERVAIDRANLLKNILANSGGNLENLPAALMQGGLMDEASKLATFQETQRKTKEAEQAYAFKQLTMFAKGVAGSGYSQQSWDQGLKQLSAMGAPDELIAQMPKEVDRNWVDQMISQSMGDEASLGQMRQNRVYGPHDQYGPQSQTPAQAGVGAPQPVGQVDPTVGPAAVNGMRDEPPVEPQPIDESRTPSMSNADDRAAFLEKEIANLYAESASRRRNGLDDSGVLTTVGQLRAELQALRERKPLPGAVGVMYDNAGNLYKDGRRLLPEEALEVAKQLKSDTYVAGGDITIGRAGMGDVDEELLGTLSKKASLYRIHDQFKPEFLELGTKLGMAWKGGLAALGFDPSPRDKQAMKDFYRFKQNAQAAMNAYIKFMTGAALSEPEAKRLAAAFPKVGEGILDGDNPIEFLAKLEEAMELVKLAEAKLVFVKRYGLSIDEVDFEDLPNNPEVQKIMNDRGAELEQQILATDPEISNDQLRDLVKQRLADEFGLTR